MLIKLKNNTKKKFVTSDLHIFHHNIIKYSNRPFNNADEMNSVLLENWNSVVSKDDVVFNLGDFSFANDEKTVEFLNKLNGIQFFVYGNHDRVMQSDKVQKFCKENGKIVRFCDVMSLRYEGHFIFMSHYAHRTWDRSHHGSLHLYGHSHGTLPGVGRSMDVGVDSTDMQSNFTPFLLDDVVEYLMDKEITASV